jgi:hypothetical protein
MEMSKGNFLYSYLKQKKSHFFFTKSENRKAKQVGISGQEEDVGTVFRSMNIVQILYTHVYKWKNETN